MYFKQEFTEIIIELSIICYFFVVVFFSQSLKNPDRNVPRAGTDLQILSWSGIAGVHG